MIRAIESDDRVKILELVEATGNFSDSEVAIAKELIDICVEQPEQKDYYAFVDSEESEVRGFLLLGPTPATSGTYDMYWIAVDPKHHGKGIAQALDRFADDFVLERNGYWLIAETSGMPNYERTRAFYTKQGYQVLARIPDYYKPGDDLFIFGKRLRDKASM
jgi:ribosomal protein S18 acetylase RimI-like enzyme